MRTMIENEIEYYEGKIKTHKLKVEAIEEILKGDALGKEYRQTLEQRLSFAKNSLRRATVDRDISKGMLELV